VHEIAGYLELSQEEVLDGLQAAHAYASTSLDAPPPSAEEDADRNFESELGTEDVSYELIDAKLAIADGMGSLPENERRILYLRFIEDMTQSEIGKRIGVSQMQVSRILRAATARLRAELGDDADVLVAAAA